MAETSKSFLSTTDAFAEKDNVLILLPDRLLVYTVPLEKLPGVIERLDKQESCHAVLGQEDWGLPFSHLNSVEIGTGACTMKLRARFKGTSESFSFSLGDRWKSKEFADWFRFRLESGWDCQQTKESRLKNTLSMWGIIAVLLGAMAFFYFGVKHGFINQAPAIFATIINTLGLNALMAIMGLIVILTLALWVFQLMKPGDSITMTKKE